MTTISASIDVLIAGAGPTGLTLAIELARRGTAFRLIDREPDRPTTSRALGTQQRTVEVFALMGIPEVALTPAVPSLGVEILEGTKTLARIAEFGAASPTARGPIIMEESATERVLEQRLTLLGGRIELGTELTAFRFADDGVVATLRTARGESEVPARYLIGADGAHSTVRRLAGIGFTGAAYPERFALADVRLDWGLSHDHARIWIGEEGLVATLPLPAEQRWRLIVSLPAADALPAGTGEQAAEAAIAQHALRALRERSGLPVQIVGEPVWASTFHIQRRLADRYREGPVLLAGDAAHVHSPVGGQGMNTGIQDAFNLGWKLALAVRHQAAPGLLDTYGDERRPIAREVLRGTDLATQMVLGRNPALRAIRDLGVPLLSRLAPVRRRLVQAISEVDIGYPRSPLSVNAPTGESRVRRERKGLRAGERVPDVALLAAPAGDPTSLFEIISRGWSLLLFTGERSAPGRVEALGALADVTRHMVGGMVQIFLVSDAALEQAPDLPLLLDPVGEARRLFGAHDGLAALVRPDGYLGYRGGPEQRLELASYLARVYALRLRGLEPEPATLAGETA